MFFNRKVAKNMPSKIEIFLYNKKCFRKEYFLKKRERKKIMIKRIMFSLFASVLLSIGVCARLSPAMDIMANRLEMKKCLTSGNVLFFDKSDFDALLGENVKDVTVCELPETYKGVLTLSGTNVQSGQVISRSQFDFLAFCPTGDFEGTASVVFESENLKARADICVVTDENSAPKSENMSMDTQKNIAVFKNVSAIDPEGDMFDIEIVDYPGHGSVEVTNDGQFVYRPLSNFIGEDEFSYRAVDVFGNASEVCFVSVNVSRPSADIYFDDMKNHWAHNSAIKMASTGLMTGERKDGKVCFNPESDMTRGDFLALSLIMTGHEKEISFVSKTVFADDSQIPDNIKSYVQYAYDKGIVSGYDNGDGTVNFESQGSVSRAEAAVIVSKVLSLSSETEGAISSYRDVEDIPVWATGAVLDLSSLGIINGNALGDFCAEKNLTRAEGAHLICNVASYLEEKNAEKEKNEKKEKNLFNLFGLLG